MATYAERKQQYKARYRALIEQLGGTCAECGTMENLTIDHKFGCKFKHNMVSSWERVVIYEREAKSGLLRVLCMNCNRIHLPILKEVLDEVPF
jgi:5-methylcytosine-specific restriction endonuclease McrA